VAACVADDKVGSEAVSVNDEVGFEVLLYLAIGDAVVTSKGNCFHIDDLSSKILFNSA